MIGALALRYSFSSVARQRSRSIRIALTVALSLAMMIVIIAVMSFLQNERFVEIRKVRSFDLVVEGSHQEELQELFPSASVFTYGEGEALVAGGAYLVRYIDEDYDGGLRFLLGDTSSLLIPYTLYKTNRLQDITLAVMKTGKSGATTVKNITYSVSGVYYTSLGSEFDGTHVFLPRTDATANVPFYTAVKNAPKNAETSLQNLGYRYQTWQKAESSLYSAFLLEKTMMYAVLLLLFVIIAVSLRQSVRIFAASRAKEMAELEILGLTRSSIRLVSLLSFLVVVSVGILLGLGLGAALLPLVSFLSSSSLFLSMELHLPWAGFAFYALFMLLLTILFSYWEAVKREHKSLVEVIHG